MKIAIYPGSFDPITNGHLDVLHRALDIFDEVIILVASNPDKKSRFSIEERLEMVRGAVKDIPHVKVDFTSGLTVNYAKKVGAHHLIRGLRAVTDFEYEFKLSASNGFIDPDIDMIFLMSHQETSFISSSSIDDLYKNGIDISPLVPNSVIEMYKKKIK
jgi:pantetheine-phosphate adenylyltransferase